MKGAAVLIVVNPVATGHDPSAGLEALGHALGAQGRTYRFFEVPGGKETRAATFREVKRALEEGCERIVAVGGDGTVSLAGEALARAQGMDGRALLGIVPAGTANVLAGELGIPSSAEAAATIAAADAPYLALDAIEIGNRLCFTQVGIGPDAVMIRDTSRASQAKLGRLAYIATFVRRGFGQPSRPSGSAPGRSSSRTRETSARPRSRGVRESIPPTGCWISVSWTRAVLSTTRGSS